VTEFLEAEAYLDARAEMDAILADHHRRELEKSRPRR